MKALTVVNRHRHVGSLTTTWLAENKTKKQLIEAKARMTEVRSLANLITCIPHRL